jgi:hypothetical protein
MKLSEQCLAVNAKTNSHRQGELEAKGFGNSCLSASPRLWEIVAVKENIFGNH